jgi:O-antigen ligase
VFFVLSPSTQDRLTTFSSSGSTSADYSIHIRHQYTHDAKAIVAAHPWIGIGVGSYVSGNAILGTATNDPHDILLLQAAEGGYLLAAGFVLLVGGTVVFLYRRRDVPLAPAAAAVMLATLAHGIVDVYWVRGTPVLGWLLVGMVCAQLYEARTKSSPT